MISIRDWLIDLANNNYWDILDDGEVVILPIKEDVGESDGNIQ